MLGYTLPDVLSYHLDVTLVKNVSLYTGNAEVDYTLPLDLVTRDSYFLALIGSSSNISPEFTILGTKESSTTTTTTSATTTTTSGGYSSTGFAEKRSKLAQKLRLR